LFFIVSPTFPNPMTYRLLHLDYFLGHAQQAADRHTQQDQRDFDRSDQDVDYALPLLHGVWR
jgi:hypothetical protein